MNDDVEQLVAQLSACDPRALVALVCAAAERLLPFYDQLGSGDPDALRQPVADLWRWVESGTPVAISRGTLDEYADLHYEEGDELMGGVVASVLRCLATYEAREVAHERALEAARALALNADTADAIGALLEGSSHRIEKEEEAWRGKILALARSPVRLDRAAFTMDAPTWMHDLLRAST